MRLLPALAVSTKALTSVGVSVCLSISLQAVLAHALAVWSVLANESAAEGTVLIGLCRAVLAHALAARAVFAIEGVVAPRACCHTYYMYHRPTLWAPFS